MNVRSSAGQLSGKLVADLEAPGQSVHGRRLGPPPRSRADSERSRAEERHHGRCACSTCRRGRSPTSNSLRGTASRRSRRGSSRPATPPSRSTPSARSTAAACDLTASAAAYGAAPPPAAASRCPIGEGQPRRRSTCAGARAPRSAAAAARAQRAAGRHRRQRRLPRRRHRSPARADRPASSRATRRFSRRRSPGARSRGAAPPAFRCSGTARRLPTPTRRSSDLDLQRIGSEFNVPALADDRYTAPINGHVIADGTRHDADRAWT